MANKINQFVIISRIMSGQGKKASNAEQIKKISIKQFEWYEVETKVRELLTELLQPFTKKQTEDTVKMNQFKRNLATMTKKLEDHDFLLTQENAEKPTYVQLQDDKIAEMEKRFIQLQIQQNKKISDMQKVVEVYENKIMQINNIQGRIQEEIKQRGNYFKSHKEHIDSKIDTMLKKLDSQDNQINNLRQTTRNTIGKLETRTVVVENKVNVIEDELKRKTQDLRRLSDQITNINQKLAATDLATKELDLRLIEREKDYKLSQKFLAKVIEVQNSVSFVQNFLQFYQPLYTQMQISETINSFLKGTMKTRACLFEEKVFAQMHYSILTMEQDSLETRMGDYSNRIRRIINRNKKYMIRMKVEQTLKYGNNVYQIREVDEALLQKTQENNNKPPQVIVPQEEIIKIVEEKWQKIVISVEKKIEEKTEPFKVWMKELQEQALLREVDLQKKANDLKSKLEKQEINIELFKSGIQHIEKDVERNLQVYIKEIKKSKQHIKDIVNFSSVINHIVIQDEIDRQGLALYALKTGNTASKSQQPYEQAYPNIHLDQKCVSCQTGNSSMIVNQAFKMACLAYNPSQIKVDDRVFTRQEILEISTNILDKLKKKLDDIEIPQKRESNTSNSKQIQLKSRSKSLISKQLNSSRTGEYSTIDVQPSRLRDTTYLLPALAAVKKKSMGVTNRDKLGI